MLEKRQSSHSIRNGDGVHGRNQSHREEHRKQGNEQLYMQDNGQDIIKPRFEECVCVCVLECERESLCVSKFLIVDAFAGRTRIYDVRVGARGSL